jgi:hypothetical protein
MGRLAGSWGGGKVPSEPGQIRWGTSKGGNLTNSNAKWHQRDIGEAVGEHATL